MKQRAIGFYWTLPVKWKPIDEITSDDLKEAGKASQKSRTIAWQREAIQRWAKTNGFEIIDELVHVELEPDRVSPISDSLIWKLAERARKEQAKILFVDFSRAIGWRKHVLLSFLDDYDRDFLAVSISDQEAERFSAHFAGWRSDYKAWLQSRDGRIARAFNRATELRDEGQTLESIAEQMNTEAIWSATGKAWTADSLRKFLKKHR